MSVDAEYLRVQAARMLALALTAQNAELSQKLTMRASDYLDQAMALELEQTATPQGSKPQPEPA